MRNYFKSKESYTKQLIKARLLQRHKRRIERVRVLKSLQPEIERRSDVSALAKMLAAKLPEVEQCDKVNST